MSATASVVADASALGIVGDGGTLNTVAIQRAIDELSQNGGGVLRFGPGHYVMGTIELRSNVQVSLDEGAVLLGSTNPADYRNPDPFMAGDGIPQGYALIVAHDVHHVSISGKGTIDGRGRAIADAQSPYTVRPFLLRWIRCQHVTLSGVTLLNPGAWTNHFFQCDDVLAADLTIRNKTTRLFNSDGIDIDSCHRVRVERCDIDTGDDAICLKTTSARPCRDVTIVDCTISTHCNGIKLGTESLGDYTNVRVANCRLGRIGMAAIAIYSVDGGHISDITVSDIRIGEAGAAASIRLGSRLKVFRQGDTPKLTGRITNVTLRNITADKVNLIGVLVNGVPGHPVDKLTLENIAVTAPGGGTTADAAIQLPEKIDAYPEFNMFGRVMPASCLYLRHARNLSLSAMNVRTARADDRPASIQIDVE